jgi:hypothetical protein
MTYRYLITLPTPVILASIFCISKGNIEFIPPLVHKTLVYPLMNMGTAIEGVKKNSGSHRLGY